MKTPYKFIKRINPYLLGFFIIFVSCFNSLYSAPLSQVSMNVPPQVLINEDFTFTVTFQNTGGDIGFGPFIDLVFDQGGADVSSTNPPCQCDGIKFISARMIGVEGGPININPTGNPISTNPCSNTNNTPNHSFLLNSSGAPQQITVPLGGQMVTLVLPFGSYTQQGGGVTSPQPEITIEITAHIDKKANVGIPVKIYARGGFRFGSDGDNNPFNEPPGDPYYLSHNITNCNNWLMKTTSPQVVIISKSFVGSENECATGPNFTNSSNLQYEILIDIANGQSISDLILTDNLPDNMQFVDLIVCDPPYTNPNFPNTGHPGEEFSLEWTPVPIGHLGNDIQVVYSFYIPLLDNSNDTILSGNCLPAISINDIKADYEWMNLDDPCMTTSNVIHNDLTNSDHVLQDKNIALQKSVQMFQEGDIDPLSFGYTPNDIIQYTLDFQISDYKTIGNLRILDTLSDGQEVLFSPVALAPTISVGDQFGNLTGNFTLNTDIYVTPSPLILCQGVNGGGEIDFRVSDIISTLGTSQRHQMGILTGGYVIQPLPPNHPPARGTITYYVRIKDMFTYPKPRNLYVDKHDPMNSCVKIYGGVYYNSSSINDTTPTYCQVTDDSKTSISIVNILHKKSIVSIRRQPPNDLEYEEVWNSSSPGFPQVMPGDRVTFKLEKVIPSGDAEQIVIEDWLPLPIFKVNDPNANGLILTDWPEPDPNCNLGYPAPGRSCFSVSLPCPLPAFTINPANNSIRFEFVPFNNTGNTYKKIEILFTMTATYEPFPDGLFLTNESRECEENTFGNTFCNPAVAQVKSSEPNVRITKGVVSSSGNPAVSYSPAAPPITLFTPSGSSSTCPRFGPNLTTPSIPPKITSSNLNSLHLNSNIKYIDANDLVTFAIVVENIGSNTHGAFDVKIKDIFPPNTCFTPIMNTICVQRGNGDVLLENTDYIKTISSNEFIIELRDPSPMQGALTCYYPNTGTNIVVITFDAVLPPNIPPGCCKNTDSLTSFSNQEGGENFVTAGFVGPFRDTANVCVLPKLTKSIAKDNNGNNVTSENIPTSISTPEPVAIGEIVRFRLQMRIPETTTPILYIIKDWFTANYHPKGFGVLNDGTSKAVIVSTQPPNSTTIPQIPWIQGNATNLNNISLLPSNTTIPVLNYPYVGTNGIYPEYFPVFNLGYITNNDNDADSEFVLIEFNALIRNVSWVPSINILSNLSDDNILWNYFSVFINNDANFEVRSPDITVRVIEPHLEIEKSVSQNPVQEGMLVTYNVAIENTGNSSAFDVQLVDDMAGGSLIFQSIVLPSGPGWSYTWTPPNNLLIECDQIKYDDPAVTISYSALSNADEIDCPETVTNNARITWTSLPGQNGTDFSAPGSTNLTGSNTPEASGFPRGERNGQNGNGGSPNDYDTTSTVDLAVECPDCVSPLPNGMVAWWSLDEPGASTQVNDIAQYLPLGTNYNNFGTPMSGLTPVPSTLDASSSPKSLPGKVGRCVRFIDENWGLIEVPDHPDINFGTNSFSIDLWINDTVHCTDQTYAAPILDKYQAGIGYRLYIQSINATDVKIILDLNGVSVSHYVANYPFDAWNFLAITVDKANNHVIFYLNNSQPSTYTIQNIGDLTNSIPLYLGRIRGKKTCTTSLDEVELFNTVLSAEDVSRIYSSDTDGKCKHDIAINKSASNTPWHVGDNRQFTLTVSNVGGLPIVATTTIHVQENLPAGLTVTSVSGNGWTITPASGAGPLSFNCNYILPTNFAPGTSLPAITFNVQVTGPGPFTNCAYVVIVNDPSHPVIPEPTYNNYHCIDIPSGCIQPPPCMTNWWAFDEQGGNVSHDIRGTSNDATWNNNPVPEPNGMVAGAMKFTGSNYLEVPDNYELNFGSNFSIDVWVYQTTSLNARSILDKRTGTIENPTGYLLYLLDGRPALQLSDGNQIFNFVAPTTVSIPNGSWHLVAITVDRNSPQGIKIYIDGLLVSTHDPTSFTGYTNNSANLLIGQDYFLDDHNFEGILDELEMFCCVLSPSDVYSIWAAQSYGKCKTLTEVIDNSEYTETSSQLSLYPNPTSGLTTITYAIGAGSDITIKVIDLLGKEVKSISEGFKSSGKHSVELSAMDLMNGTYYIKLISSNKTVTLPLMIIR